MAQESRKLLSNKEWIVFNAACAACEGRGNATVSEILELVQEKEQWGFSTVKTMLERLVDKNVLSCDVRGRTAFYSPAQEKSMVARRDITERLDAILEGAMGPLVSYLADRKKLSRKEVEELTRLLDDKKEA